MGAIQVDKEQLKESARGMIPTGEVLLLQIIAVELAVLILLVLFK